MKRALLILTMLVLLAAPAIAQVGGTVNATLVWDKSSDDSRDPASAHPIGYKVHVCLNAAGDNCQTAIDVGTALEKPVQLAPNSLTFYFITAYWDAVEGCADCGIQESGRSNILRVQVFNPPGNPGNAKVKVVTVARGRDPGVTLRAALR